VPTPFSTIDLDSSSASEGTSSQNLMLLRRGYAISGALSMSGTIQLPKPPIILGITIKKIITNAWAVTTTL